MKSILALVTLVLAVVVLEEEVRGVAGEAQNAYGEVVEQARGAAGNFSQSIRRQPAIAVLIGGSLGYVVGRLTTARKRVSRS